MKNLPAPTDDNDLPYVAGDVYETCISRVRSRDLREQLRSIRPKVEIEASDYDSKAVNGQLYRKHPHDQVGTVSGDEIVKVYTIRMVKKTASGRPIYDKIMSVPAHRICPLCGVGIVNTLDHYLPKTHFPVFSVTPNNLVPACEWCQGNKGEYFPVTFDSQIFHPYFDNLENDVWLAAEVVIGAPAGFRYFSDPPAHWNDSFKARAVEHLKRLNLHLLYSSNAGSRLSEIRYFLSMLHDKGGIESVRAHLQEQLVSVEVVYKNSWVAAMLRAAISSDWFCDGGFFEE